MKRIAGLVLVFIAACQPLPQKSHNEWLFRAGDLSIGQDEFVYAFEKNNFDKDSTHSEEEIRDYLDLYINFKLKVLEARSMGLDTLQAYKNELEGYRKQLAAPYLTESSVTEQLLEEAYERLQEEIRASHILIMARPGMSPEDTLKSYNLIHELRDRTEGGEDFASLAREYSQDPSVQRNNGDLGYFSAFQMVYPFESAAYQTKKDSISDVIKTQFGYHILKVTDRRETRGEIKVSHIMIRATDNLSAEDSILAKKKIDEIYKRLNEGGDWLELCREFSQDVNTRNTGGQLPWLSTGNVPPSFENAAFTLKDKGQFTPPVKTPYGWHIIKLDDKRGLDSFDSMKDELARKVQNDSRSELSSKAFFNRVKRENGFKEYKDSVNQSLTLLDSSLFKGQWKKPKTYRNTKLFTIKGNPYSVSEFYLFIEKNQRITRETDLETLGKRYYDGFLEKSLTEFEDSHLSEKYFDYRMLYQEYAEGIMLFQLMDDKIWTGAVRDSSGLEQYYQEHKNNYMAEERVSAQIYNAASDSIRSEILKMIESGDSLIQSKKELKSYFNEKSALNLQTREGLFDYSDPVIGNMPEKSPGKYTFELNNRFYLLIVDKIVPPEPLPLEEIRGKVISDYQEYLENKWTRELKEKYKVEINKKALDRLIHELENK